MKKLTALAVAAVLSLSMVSCSSNPDNNTNPDDIDSVSYKVGIGSYTTTGKSTSSYEGENGRGVVCTTYATVIFDSNDIIQKVYIDQVESKVYFDADGQIAENTVNEVRSKRELGDEYGMKEASPIGKEWYEQVNYLESWLVGRNVNDISYGLYDNMYGTDSNSDSVTGPVEGAAQGVAEGAESLVGDVVSGAENIADSIAGGMEGMADGSSTESTADGTTGNISNSADENANSGGAASSSGSINWEEDLKSSVTIDLTDIRMAIMKAYNNAR